MIDIEEINTNVHSHNNDMSYENKFSGLRALPKELVTTKKVSKRVRSYKSVSSEAEELKRFALMTINNRIEFCQKYKTGEEEIGKCVCESVRRYIRLSKESASRGISKKQLNAIKKMFEEMKKDGRIKCQESL